VLTRFFQRLIHERVPVPMQEIEEVIDQRRRPAGQVARLEQLKPRTPGIVEGPNLTIEHGVAAL